MIHNFVMIAFIAYLVYLDIRAFCGVHLIIVISFLRCVMVDVESKSSFSGSVQKRRVQMSRVCETTCLFRK